GRKLIVGTKQAEPFAIKNNDGTWSGVSIDLWREIAAELQLDYELWELDLTGLIEGVKDGSLDAAVAALTLTAEREEVIDFTHPFYTTGFSIAVPPRGMKSRIGVLKRFFSLEFLKAVTVLALVLLTFGMLVWLFERNRNPKQFGGGVARGIGSGFWWSAVTMATVGYGDKVPVTFGGRLIGVVWMFTAVIIISSFTAAITSSLTVTQLESSIRGPEDLPKVRVGTVPSSTSESYLRDRRISYKSYKTPLEGLRAIASREIDAMVYDAPILRYLVNTELKGTVEVLSITFERQDYGIALPMHSPLREPINRTLLEKIRQPGWQDILYRYLGN
ncbi:MAG: transporter substrate-binding domain-containing protein, partial [Nitrospira sp.]|nr:transporter substrate-binding domain-containing protein [Nitrospira sp.]